MKLFKKHGTVNSFLRERPKLYDYSRLVGDLIIENKAEYFSVFKKLSQHLKGQVNFVQIGANDGLRNDPMRDFIVRNQGWKGILVEPLPYSYNSLIKNYAYLGRQNLHFENAAVGEDDQPDLAFWSYKESFLSGLSHEQQEGFRRKSSFSQEHLLKFLPESIDLQNTIESVPVKIISVKSLLEKYGMDTSNLHLLAVDAEGYDREIIETTLAHGVKPDVIYFESHHLPEMDVFFDTLTKHDYLIQEYRRDTIALRPSLKTLLD